MAALVMRHFSVDVLVLASRVVYEVYPTEAEREDDRYAREMSKPAFT